jgi:hypothetical protein
MSIEFDFSGQNPDFQKALLSAGFAPFSGVGGSRSAFAPSFATFAPQQQNQAPASPFTAQTGENFAGDGDSAGDGRGEHGFFGDAVSPDFGSFARSVAGIPGMMSGVGMAAAVASPFARSMLGMPQVSNVSLTGVVKDVLGIPSISSIFGLDPAPTASPFGHSPSISQDDIGEPNTPAQDVDIASQVDSFSELGDPAGSQAAADQAAGTTGAQGGDANGDASDGDAASDTGADGSDGQSSEGGNGPGDFAGGGYTGAGPIDEVAGRVHRNEYVIPADMVAENPRFIQEIETARRAREYTHQNALALTPRQEAIRSAVGNAFASMIPGVGDVMDAREGYDTLREAGGDFERGDYLSGIGNTLSGAAIGASALIPFLGMGGIKRAAENVGEAVDLSTRPYRGRVDMGEIQKLDAGYQAKISAGDKRRAYDDVLRAAGVEKTDSSISRGGAHAPSGVNDGAPAYDLTGNGIYPDDVYSHNGLRYYATGDDRLDQNAYATLRRLEGKPNAQVKIYRAVEKGADGKIIPGDWVTTERAYAKSHGEANISGEFKIVSKTVTAKDIYTSGDSWLEWGYSPQAERFWPSLRSLDNDGKVLPLTSRFGLAQADGDPQ